MRSLIRGLLETVVFVGGWIAAVASIPAVGFIGAGWIYALASGKTGLLVTMIAYVLGVVILWALVAGCRALANTFSDD